MTGKKTASTAGTIVFLLFGPLAWSSHLAVAYAFHTFACRFGAPEAVPSAITVATVVALCAAVVPAVAPSQLGRGLGAGALSRQTFIGAGAGLLALLSAAGIAWIWLSVFLAPACIPMR